MNISLPKWLAKLLFPKLEAELSQRAKLTGTASRSFEIERGPFVLSGVAEVEDDKTKRDRSAGSQSP